jgi:hypothetical protein
MKILNKLSFSLVFIFLLEAYSFGQCTPCLHDPEIDSQTSSLVIPGDCSTNTFCFQQYYDQVPINSFSSIGGDWMLIAYDEFNGPGLDETFWFNRMPWGNDDLDNGASTPSIEIPQNISFSNGKLKLRCNYDGSVHDLPYLNPPYTQNSIKRDYTSARISSKISLPIDSRYQMSSKMYPAPLNVWSDFWLYGDRDQEIDIFEFGMEGSGDGSIDQSNVRSVMKSTVHAKQWGNPSTTTLNEATDYFTYQQLDQGTHQYDLIWDNWKTQFYFDGNVIRNLCKLYYCPSSWTQSYLNNHKRENPIHNYSDAVAHIGEHFAYSQYFPSYSAMTLLIGVKVINGAPQSVVSDPTNTMDVDYVKIWLRANCNGDINVSSLNFIQGGGLPTAYEMGRKVTTNSSITIPNNDFGIFAATQEIALMDGFSALSGSTFSAFITVCEGAWDQRAANSNAPNDTNKIKIKTTFTDNHFDSNGENSVLYQSYSIKIQSSQNEFTGYELYNSAGSLISKGSDNSTEINISKQNLSDGIYYVRLFKNNTFDVKKIVIQN